ncbi:MAG: uracil-DNA glycosylase [Candidatus Omnitrophica bacterium]|nr:uracil-DNA glycosylase [Candidatus Omnitrophota bacterium]
MSPPRPDKSETVQRAVRSARRRLEALQALGVTSLPAPKEKRERSSKAEILQPIQRQAEACRACRLHETRKSVVFGEGSLEAPVVFVGEGPGREEDLQGRPFVGQAGGLLTKMIFAMGFKREAVYIANVVKCRPPMNRPPEPDEVAACSSYLKAQLETIRPRVICALGRTAASTLLKTSAPMAHLRGKAFAWEGIPVVVTFHPAYLLRNPSAKTLVWQDLQQVLALLQS